MSTVDPPEVSVTDLHDAMVRDAKRLHRQNRVLEAIEAYQRILARWPALADCWFNLAVLQRQERRLNDALESYRKALDAGVSRPEEAHLNRSVIYTDYLHEHGAAERELNLALSVNPEFTPALLNLANLYEDLGRRDEAIALYERIIGRDPRCFEALARYANVQPRTTASPALVEQLRRALADTAATPERASLGFALGRLLDAAGEYPDAFGVYQAANEASRASTAPEATRYDRARHQVFVDRIIASSPTDPAAKPLILGPRPIFICGMFRSGSTLAEHLLSHCTGITAGGEFDFLPRLVATELTPFPESLATLSGVQLDNIVSRYRAELARVADGGPYVIDKRPDNFLYIGLIKKLFPDAKIIHTTRDPLDNCLSIYFLHLDQQMSYASNLMDIGHYFREYRRLMAHWKREFAADIFDFDYDTLIRDPQPTLGQLCAFLGLDCAGPPPQVELARAVKTASVWQVREPLYRSSSGRARHYQNELKELHGYMADLLPA